VIVGFNVVLVNSIGRENVKGVGSKCE